MRRPCKMELPTLLNVIFCSLIISVGCYFEISKNFVDIGLLNLVFWFILWHISKKPEPN